MCLAVEMYDAKAQTILPPNSTLHRTASVLANKIYVRFKPNVVSPNDNISAILGAGFSAKQPILLPKQSVTFSATVSAEQLSKIQARRNFAKNNNPKLKIVSMSDFDALQELFKAEDPLLRTYLVDFSSNDAPEIVAQRLRKNPKIEIAEPHSVEQLLSNPNDPMIGSQAMLNTIKAFDGWNIYQGDTSMVIGISDNGVFQEHIDLAGSLAANFGEIANNGTDDDNNGYIDDFKGYNFTVAEDQAAGYPDATYGNTFNDSYNGHGTSVAGIAGASTNNGIGIAGVGYKSRIFPIKVVVRSASDIVAGYESMIYAAVRGFKVLNCSWGASDSYNSVNESIVDFAISRDVAICAGGGNDGNSLPFFPAAYRGVLGVGNTFYNDKVFVGLGSSSYGAHIGVMAPGENTYSTSYTGGYSSFGGTSGATPIVSGIVALIRSKHPELSSVEAIEFLKQCTDNIEAANPDFYGKIPGRVNMLKAMTNNPFATPSIRPISLVFKTLFGNNARILHGGDTLLLGINAKNYLGKGTTLKFTLSTLEDNLPSIKIIDNVVNLDSVSANSDVNISYFKILVNQPTTAHIFFRVDIQSTNGWKDFFSIRFLPNSTSTSFSTFSNDSLTFSMSDFGTFGFSDYESHDIGTGFQLASFGNLLYRGGIIAVEGSTGRVSSAVQGDSWSNIDRNFIVLKPFDDPDKFTGIIADSNNFSTRKVGVQITQKITLPSNSSTLVTNYLTVKNTSGSTLFDAAVGYYFDWDIGSGGENNFVRLFPEGIPNNHSNAVLGLVERTDGIYPYIVCGAYSSEWAYIPQFAGFDNDASAPGTPLGVNDGFSDADKVRALTSGTALQYPNLGEIGCVTGMKFAGACPAGQERSFYLIFGASGSKEKLQADCQTLLGSFPPYSVADGTPIGNEWTVFPQPAMQNFTIHGNLQHSGMVEMRVLTLLGNDALLPRIFPAEAGDVTISGTTDGLSSGIYRVILSSNGMKIDLPIVIAR